MATFISIGTFVSSLKMAKLQSWGYNVQKAAEYYSLIVITKVLAFLKI